MICLTLASSPAVAFLSFLHFEKSLVTRFRVERWLTLHVCARSLTVEHSAHLATAIVQKVLLLT